ncbi:MAG TPA: hypothetical protein VKE51_30620 [Vicinamibacterales bacterium]|nr:hypothetical protein [Vicinamibacterales bacterium]
MTAIDPYLLVRAASLYLTAMATAAACLWRRPDRRAWSAALLASLWNLPMLFALNVAADRAGWWHYDARGGLLAGVPVDLWLSWTWLWGAVPALACPSLPIAIVAALAVAVDLVLMPTAAPVIVLGRLWLTGDALGVVVALVPAQLLARWTARDERLAGRAVLQVIAFTGIVVVLLPVVAIEGSAAGWVDPIARPAWQRTLILQMLAAPAILGMTAVQEFVTRGRGTPVPFDPPRRLVTSGVYAYLRNPMQLSGALLLVLLGPVLGNLWVSAAGVMAHVYSAGLASWDEDEDLLRRFGDDWSAYRRARRRWVPAWRPWYDPRRRLARLYVAESCAMCSEVAGWFERRAVTGLEIVAAETHPSRTLSRITYAPADGSCDVSGIEAVARALEHVHFGWALAGFTLRLPVVRPIVQLIVDASGGGPRRITRNLSVARSHSGRTGV